MSSTSVVLLTDWVVTLATCTVHREWCIFSFIMMTLLTKVPIVNPSCTGKVRWWTERVVEVVFPFHTNLNLIWIVSTRVGSPALTIQSVPGNYTVELKYHTHLLPDDLTNFLHCAKLHRNPSQYILLAVDDLHLGEYQGHDHVVFWIVLRKEPHGRDLDQGWSPWLCWRETTVLMWENGARGRSRGGDDWGLLYEGIVRYIPRCMHMRSTPVALQCGSQYIHYIR